MPRAGPRQPARPELDLDGRGATGLRGKPSSEFEGTCLMKQGVAGVHGPRRMLVPRAHRIPRGNGEHRRFWRPVIDLQSGCYSPLFKSQIETESDSRVPGGERRRHLGLPIGLPRIRRLMSMEALRECLANLARKALGSLEQALPYQTGFNRGHAREAPADLTSLSEVVSFV